DKKNILLINNNFTPLLTGILIAIMTVTIQPFHNIILNPAIDLGPRIFLSFIGWGTLAFTGGMKVPYFLIPILGPIIGANIGGWIYYKIFSENLVKK
ncbi:MAG: aquaporin, partial [Buchnera aphidicola]|nr:aquaporin [Buchnera aphidicola]